MSHDAFVAGHPGTSVQEQPSAPWIVTGARRLRIAMFSYGLPCPGVKRGGIEQVAHDLANALSDRGHQVTVFTYDPKPASARYEISSLPYRQFVTSWLGRRLTMGYLGNVLALGPGYRGYDAIVAHGDSLLLPLLGKPLVRIMHGSAWEEARSATSIGRRVLQAGVYVQELTTAALQKGTVAVSTNTRHLNPFIRRTIPNGVDLTRFRADESQRSERPRIVFVGALTGRKRGSWLLERFMQDIQPKVPDAELHMVTTPGPAARGVVYHTGIAPEALIRLYQSAWVYASPSTYEGFGLPYVEAMACGTPVVATPNPGSLEVLDGGTAGCLSADADFAADVVSLLQRDARWSALAEAGKQRARVYDIARGAADYEALIESLVTK